MRGQAFLTFPNQILASNALEEVNGYMLGGKPMVMSFSKEKLSDVQESITSDGTSGQPQEVTTSEKPPELSTLEGITSETSVPLISAEEETS